jgi:hypothetical protein
MEVGGQIHLSVHFPKEKSWVGLNAGIDMIQKEGKTITIFIPCIVKFVNAQPSKYY